MRGNKMDTCGTVSNRESKAQVLMHSINNQGRINDRLLSILDKIREGVQPEGAKHSLQGACDPVANLSTVLNSGPEILSGSLETAMNFLDQLEQELF